ncbi:hypothetical protein TNCV_1542531 [Trichonephila clavipes]|nr:hypothetical protein TNCV_1542531 [Trichonephila clavipes]
MHVLSVETQKLLFIVTEKIGELAANSDVILITSLCVKIIRSAENTPYFAIKYDIVKSKRKIGSMIFVSLTPLSWAPRYVGGREETLDMIQLIYLFTTQRTYTISTYNTKRMSQC